MEESILTQLATSSPSATRPILETRGMSLQFGRQVVLKDISVRINKGETVAIIGESGCGKTMFLKALVGLLSLTSGSVIFDGQDITGMESHEIARRGVARTFQMLRIFSGMSVIENMLAVVDDQ